MSTIIVVGASAAGLAACGKLRDLSPTARIICITKEQSMPYNRCLIADFLSGNRTEAQVHTKGKQFFVDNDIELMLGCEVVSMDVDAKTVTLHNGIALSYDALLIATGRSAFVPPVLSKLIGEPLKNALRDSSNELPQGERLSSGISTTNPLVLRNDEVVSRRTGAVNAEQSSSTPIFPFYDLSHAQNILDFIGDRTNLHALIVGGGISGLECADALVQRGVRITMIERGPHLLPRQMDAAGAQFLQQLMTKSGGSTAPLVEVHCNTTIKEIKNKNLDPRLRGENEIKVTLSNENTIEVDFIIAATGGRQNLQFAQAAGINCNEFGIVVDQHQATNFDEIYAAGDVCSVNDLRTDKPTCSTLWPDAVAQGLTAAHSIALYLLTSDEHARLPNKTYAGTLNITSTNIFGTTLVTGGDFGIFGNVETITKQEDGFYHCLYVHDGILQGFVMVGNVTGIGQLRKAIIDKTKIV